MMNCFFMFQENFHSFNKLFINGMEERIFCFNLNRIHQFLSHSRLWRLFYVKKYNRTNCCSCLGNKYSLRKCKSQQKHSLIDAQWAKKMEKQYKFVLLYFDVLILHLKCKSCTQFFSAVQCSNQNIKVQQCKHFFSDFCPASTAVRRVQSVLKKIQVHVLLI